MPPSSASYDQEGPTTKPFLGPGVPQHKSVFFQKMGDALLRIAGWELKGQIPNIPKFIIIVAPHTSNWDFPLGLATKWALGLKVSFLGKDTLFLPPLGWFMRAIGGIPVARKAPTAIVQRTVSEFNKSEQLVLVLAPEGTRKKVDRWKSGFWHIANESQMPILCAALDWKNREVRFGPLTQVDNTTDPEKDILRIRSFFTGVEGYYSAKS